ncbi:MAG: flavin monoamine oxidase family protein, partial [Terriglobales bacterium]
PDCSFDQFAGLCRDLPAAALKSARDFIEGFEAADPGQISVFSLNRERLAEMEDGTGDLSVPRRPLGGYSQLLHQLQTPVELGCVVEGIRWRRGNVVIAARRGGEPLDFRARRTLITLPLGVLQAQPGLFDPPLSAKKAALRCLVMSDAMRVTLRLRRPLWEEAEMPRLGFLFAGANSSGHFPVWWVRPGNAAQITGWAAGRHAWAMAGKSPEQVQSRAVADLAAALALPATQLEADLIAAHSHAWLQDPFSLGAYSYARAGSADAFAALATPVDGTLYFAGEATDNTGRHATVHGALRSARRAVAEITARA